jgi:hypothetical protein
LAANPIAPGPGCVTASRARSASSESGSRAEPPAGPTQKATGSSGGLC